MPSGQSVWISIGTPNIGESIEVWQKLGFELLQMDMQPYPWAQLTDGSVKIMLNQDGLQYLGLLYFNEKLEAEKKRLKKLGIEAVFATGPDDPVSNIIYSDPDENMIGITEGEKEKETTGKRFIHLKEDEYDQAEVYPNEVTGIFGELSLPVKDLEKSIAYWTNFGFDVLGKYDGKEPWAILDDGLITVGLYQTSEFNAPTVTFFAKDMAKRLPKLKENELPGLKPWTGQGGSEGNAVVAMPSGFEVFLFSF